MCSLGGGNENFTRRTGAENVRMQGQAKTEEQPTGVHRHQLHDMPGHRRGHVTVDVLGHPLDLARFIKRHYDRVANRQKHGTGEDEPSTPSAGVFGKTPRQHEERNAHDDEEDWPYRFDGGQQEGEARLHVLLGMTQRKSLIKKYEGSIA